ncbi:MAG TPA: hypothetical protein PKJ97_02570 [Candidatus Bilamarchaeaceae archaeon]|nr:hypothetical protein [Candidatus Bilamarchaeaceae archaeon]
MKAMMLVALLALISGFGLAQGADEYCAAERAEGESCYRSCCEMLGYTWSGGGCDVPEANRGHISTQCAYCTDSYMECRDYYEQMSSGGGYPTGSGSGSGGCCGSAMILLAVPLLAAFRR